MKKTIFSFVIIASIISCNNKKQVETNENEKTAYVSFGDSISDEKALTSEEMAAKYETLKEGDTLNVKFKSQINTVCKKKGCWMTLNLGKDKEAFVKFKDYGFFVPKNADNEQAVVNGKAFVSIESVNELKHYAKDEGKSQAAIDSIVAPEVTYSFLADGVLIKK
ncbi:MAG: hypothetical protein RL494_601 [Bacteroidota bacterium]|jgi:hypothetical protein